MYARLAGYLDCGKEAARAARTSVAVHTQRNVLLALWHEHWKYILARGQQAPERGEEVWRRWSIGGSYTMESLKSSPTSIVGGPAWL